MNQNPENTQDLTGKVFQMPGLVTYQEGAVVSRTIIDKQVGTVTLFAFDSGQGMSEHTMPFAALVCVLEGQAKIIISGESRIVNDGEMIIMPANQPHELKAQHQFKMMLVMIRQ